VHAVQLIAEVGPALMYQAVSKSLLKIGAHLSRLNIDVTEVPADGVSNARSASPLLLLIEAAQVCNVHHQSFCTPSCCCLGS